MEHAAPIGRYAHIEREQRFLLAEAPRELTPAAPHWDINDRYIRGTRFRLRRMVASDSGQATYKLTQKYPPDPADLARIAITNTYLTEREYETFRQLAADELLKDRYPLALGGRTRVVDVFRGSLAGLILAEIELDSDEEFQSLVPPPWGHAEVTGDSRFTGGTLCRATSADLGRGRRSLASPRGATIRAGARRKERSRWRQARPLNASI